MNALQIKPTASSLAVLLNAETGSFSFSGRSVSEHSAEFFKPVMEWMEQYALAPAAKTECVFELEYFNSAARKSLVEILKILFALHKKGAEVVIVWNYDDGDESIKELGEEYANLFSMKFKFIAN